MVWLYSLGKLVTRTLFVIFTRSHVRGKENIPGSGPVLVVANHLHLADPPLVAINIPRDVRFMAKEELFRSRLVGFIFRSVGAFPVHRGRVDRRALSQAERVLTSGSALLMFPESTRSRNAQLQKAFPGAALLASRHGVPVLPVGIAGTEKIKGVRSLLRRPRVVVNIGAPFYLPSSNGRLTKTDLAEYTALIMERVAGLLPAEYRGHYRGKGM